MILIHSALSDDRHTVVDSVELELTNMDLKSISSRSLPDPHTLRKSSHLLGPKVLQPPPNIQYAALVISCSFIIEGASLLVAIQAVKKGAAAEGMKLRDYIWRRHDPTYVAVMTKDGAAVTGLGTPRELGSRDLSNFLSSLSHTSVQHKPDVYAQTNIYDEHQRSQWAWCVCVVLC
ncbi:hypothetical protein TB2_026251 [Malus domestica]